MVPFLQAIDRQFAFYQLRGIDMFKQGISVPGLTLLYLFNDLPRRPTLQSSTRRIKIFITSSKITWLAELRSFFTAITRKGSPRYVSTSTERPLVRVGRSSGTMPTPCTCGHSCKTCLWDGTRDDGKITTSVPNRRSCTDRWLRNG